jgi:hypothetical protein
MVNSSLTLTHPDINGGSPVKIRCTSLVVQSQKNNEAKPRLDQMEATEVHTQSINNLAYNATSVHFIDEAGTLSYSDVLTLLKHKYDGSNPAILNVNYGGKDLIGMDGTTNIKVILQSYSFPINMTDSRDGYMPTGNLNFIETA